MASTLAVVWVRAALHQANRLSAKFWLISPDLIEGQLNEVRTMRKILDQAHQLRDLLTRALDPFLLRRVLIDLDGVVSGLDAGALDDATATRIQGYLRSFEDWLAKDKILNAIRSMRGGNLNDPRFKSRMRGEGIVAERIKQLFEVSKKRYGLHGVRRSLSVEAFRRPGEQMALCLS